ncbi:MAG TPA: type II secretion system protein [Steroidobacteraceae bacterium]|nr:type II secretion system protein [Steroidobacteraceae bacterium]
MRVAAMPAGTHRRTGRAPQRGFTYLGLLFAIAILGITLATIGIVWSAQIQRDREAELLYIGNQYRAAIGRYVGSGGQYPQELADLVADKRFPVARRYLRRLYPDPMTNSADWGLILAPAGGIIGVVSRSQGKPIKVAGFLAVNSAFEKTECYCDWKFIYAPRARGRRRGNSPVLPQLPTSILQSLPQSAPQPQPLPQTQP